MNKYDIYLGDCLEVMDQLIEQGITVDMILTDPPYGITACKWDNIIPFDELWLRLNSLIKDNGAIALFGNMPFTANLTSSNIKAYKHHWIWKKNRGTGFQAAKYRPMIQHEDIIVFSKNGKRVNYNPQKIKLDKSVKYSYSSKTEHFKGLTKTGTYIVDSKYPTNIIEFDKVSKPIHPTQKPVALLEYLIKTYTNEGDVVLDFTMGSGSTGVACMNTNRKFIGIELEEKYYNIAKQRIEEANEPSLFNLEERK